MNTVCRMVTVAILISAGAIMSSTAVANANPVAAGGCASDVAARATTFDIAEYVAHRKEMWAAAGAELPTTR